MTKRPTLILFDAHAILHRAYHALPDFTTAKGEQTGALYGLSTLLLKTIDTFHPDRMAACFDLPEPTFRHKTYDAYKGKRPEIEESLIRQINRARDVFQAFNIPIFDAPGFEADDVIGTIAETAKDIYDVIIVSGDMDTLQLVDDKKVRVFTLKKGINDTILYDEEAVNARFGFGPAQLPDYKGLRGDPSDNIIGIPGIGEKTGSILITTFGTIEKMYAALQKKNAGEVFQKAGISPRIVELFRAHEDDARFSKMLATIRRDAPVVFARTEAPHMESWNLDVARALFDELEFRSLKRKIDTIGVARGDAPRAEVQEQLLGGAEISESIMEKARIAIWLLDSDKTNPTPEDLNEFPGKTPEEKLASAEKEIVRLNLEHVYHHIELPLIPIIKRAQDHGILIDVPYLSELSREYHKKLDYAAQEVFRHAGETFNINSPKQLGVILFDKLNLTAKGLKKTEGGARSTRESELEKLKDTHPIIAAVLEYREYQKLLSTYIDTIPTLVDKEGRLHTTLHQTGAATGRMSSSNPGLQNIPVREGIGEAIRDAFVAPRGHVLLAFDYSQIEMRVLALLSGDTALIEIFKGSADVHTSVAARVFKVPPQDVTKDMRRRAKVINFGIIYGMGVSALKRSLGSSTAEAQTFYDDYLGAFPQAAAFLEKTVTEAKKQGFTETLFGRRRYVRDITARLPFVRAAAERAAKNAPIQGTAADFIKLAMIRADKALQMRQDITLLLQVHDELIYEVVDDAKIITDAIKSIRGAMEGVYAESPIPLTVSVKKGRSWGSMDEVA